MTERGEKVGPRASEETLALIKARFENRASVFVATNDFSSTINAGARSALVNIPGVPFNSIRIVGVAAISELNTDWRLKFYKKDTGIAAAYNSDTYIGDLEVVSLSPTEDTYFEGSVEANLHYWDADMTGEIHVIAENIGPVNNSKLFLNILYIEAD